MFYQFDSTGKCVSTATGPIEPMEGIVSIYAAEAYSDLENIKLINGEVYHLEPEKDDVNETDLSS